MLSFRSFSVLLIALALTAPACAAPMGAAFTYQGKLTDSAGVPLSGAYDMSFRLYDAPKGGAMVGDPVFLTAVNVAGGLFTIQLDFGASAFNGQRRWLATTVGTETLTPRVEVTWSPYAIYSQTAAAASSVPWSGVSGAPAIPTVLPPSGPAGGSLSGTYPNPTIADSAVTSAKLSDASVTASKLADGSVTSAKLASGALSGYSGDVQALAAGGASLAVLGSVATNGAPQSVTVSGRYVYVTNQGGNNYSLQIIDVSKPTGPTTIASGVTGPGTELGSIAVSGNHLYAVNTQSRKLKIFDISNPSSPVTVGEVTTSSAAGSPSSVAVSGRYAYVTGVSGTRLQSIDISNPAAPTITGSGMPGPGGGDSLTSLTVSGRYAYAVDTVQNRLYVFDVSNPANMTTAGSVVTGVTPWTVAVSGRYAYVVCKTSATMQIFDIANPAAPTLVGSVSTGGSTPYSVAVSGRYAYVTNFYSQTMHVFDVSDPANPIQAAWGPTDACPCGVAVVGKRAYVISYLGKTLQVLDVTGVESTAVNAHSLEAGSLQVRDSAAVGNQLSVVGGLNVGLGGILSSGSIASSEGAYFGGRVGIGTTAPAAKLDVSGGANLAGALTINDTGTARALTLTGNGEAAADTGIGHPADGVLSLIGNGVERVSVASSGKVGIGTTAPDEALSVVGSIKVDQGDSNSGNFSTAAIRFGAGSTGEGIASKRTSGGNWAGLDFYTGSVNRMTVSNSGKVGVGTTAPIATLQVEGSEFSDADNLAGPLYIKELTNNVDTAAGKTVLAFKRVGKFGVAYDNSVAFQLKRYSQAGFGASSQMDILMGNGSVPKPEVTVMSLLANGNVGIGYTSPAYKLDVNGTIRGSNVSPSDVRLKTNVSTISNALESTAKLRGVTFDWNTDAFSDKSFPEGRQIGVIAQEVEKVFPELVSTDDKGYESVAYDKLVPVLIEAIKDLKARVDAQQREIDELKARQ